MIHVSGMFVFVTVDTQVLPVTTIRRVVVVIMVLVVDGQLVKVLPSKLAAATPADPRMNFERLLPVTVVTVLALLTGPRDDFV
jgi:hypothetical protein